MVIPPEKRRRCNDNALHSFGTAYIFEKRASSIRKSINLLTFLGIATPAMVGAVIGTFSLSPQNTKYVLIIAGILGLLQLVLSIWAIVSGWNDRLSYYLESKSANYRLADEFSQLANSTSLSEADFETRLQVLDKEMTIRNDLDNRHNFSDKEKRMGMRVGLRQYQRHCVKCGQIPSLKPSNCDVCGK